MTDTDMRFGLNSDGEYVSAHPLSVRDAEALAADPRAAGAVDRRDPVLTRRPAMHDTMYDDTTRITITVDGRCALASPTHEAVLWDAERETWETIHYVPEPEP